MTGQHDDANSYLMGGGAGARAATFRSIGDHIDGVIATEPELRQQVDFETRKPKFWDDGNPMMEIRVTLQTTQRDTDDPEDDGRRALYLRGDLLRAVREAVRVAKAAGLQLGGALFVKHSGVGQPKQRGFNGPKLYEANYDPPASGAVDPDDIPF